MTECTPTETEQKWAEELKLKPSDLKQCWLTPNCPGPMHHTYTESFCATCGKTSPA
jgi:hypothetical protein